MSRSEPHSNPSPSRSPLHEADLENVIANMTAHIRNEYENHFGVFKPGLAEKVAVEYADIRGNANWRFDLIQQYFPTAKRILDLASGFGTALWHGQLRGYDMVGLEPAIEKQILARQLLLAHQCPPGWGRHLASGLGENLPFKANSFDVVTSYQTLEHVQNPKAVLRAMIGVTREGGGIHLRCPDYSGTFEGHYLLPWLPLLPRPIANLWLLINQRPKSGLESITYVTAPRILKWLSEIQTETPGLVLSILALEHERFKASLKSRGLPSLKALYSLYCLRRFFLTLFRQEKALHILIQIRKQSINGVQL